MCQKFGGLPDTKGRDVRLLDSQEWRTVLVVGEHELAGQLSKLRLLEMLRSNLRIQHTIIALNIHVLCWSYLCTVTQNNKDRTTHLLHFHVLQVTMEHLSSPRGACAFDE